jgi:hypothetical protein
MGYSGLARLQPARYLNVEALERTPQSWTHRRYTTDTTIRGKSCFRRVAIRYGEEGVFYLTAL